MHSHTPDTATPDTATPDTAAPDTAAPTGQAPGLNRRRALCGILVALAAPGVLSACSSGTETGGAGGAAPTTGGAAPAGGTPVSSIPVGGGTIVDGPSGPVLLTQPTAGTVKAFDAACPHQGTTVDPPADGVVVCPNHGSEFNPTTGALLQGPAQTGLTELPIRIADGQVQFA